MVGRDLRHGLAANGEARVGGVDVMMRAASLPSIATAGIRPSLGHWSACLANVQKGLGHVARHGSVTRRPGSTLPRCRWCRRPYCHVRVVSDVLRRNADQQLELGSSGERSMITLRRWANVAFAQALRPVISQQ